MGQSLDSSTAAEERSTAASRLIHGFGAAYTLVLVIYLLASPFLAAVAPIYRARGVEGMGKLLVRLTLPEALASAARGEGPLNIPIVFVSTYAGLVLTATVFWLAGLGVIYSYREAINASHVRSIVRWSVVFVAVLLLATPVVVHDLWLAVVWGRVVADGFNPYYVLPTAYSDLPYQKNPGRVTYGPLWTLFSGGSAVITGGSALGIALLQKILIAGCWVGVIRSVKALTTSRGSAEQCMALLVVGWAPLALFVGIGDGHNDPIMVLPMLLWLLWIERGGAVWSGFALGVSISIKYVTAPLLLLHVVRDFVHGRGRRSSLVSAAICCLVVLIALAVFYRSPNFFDATRHMKGWKFYTPSAVVSNIALNLGFSRWGIIRAVNVLVLLIAGGFVTRWLLVDSREAFRAAVLWMLSGILIGYVGHVWPWFVLWLLPLAAIQLARRIAWFVVGITVAAPFIILPWTAYPQADVRLRFMVPGLILYSCGLVLVRVSGQLRSYFR